jgi:hypothetical protein
VQPWHYFRVRPMLRGLCDGDVAARALMTALGTPESVPVPAAAQRPVREVSVSPRPATAATA